MRALVVIVVGSSKQESTVANNHFSASGAGFGFSLDESCLSDVGTFEFHDDGIYIRTETWSLIHLLPRMLVKSLRDAISCSCEACMAARTPSRRVCSLHFFKQHEDLLSVRSLRSGISDAGRSHAGCSHVFAALFERCT